MDDAALARRLAALEPPALDQSRQRAMRSVAARLPTIHRTPPRKHRRMRVQMRFAAVLASLCAALTVGALLTPPGHAITSWIGDRLGFGQPGGPPTLRDLRDFATKGSAAADQPAYVLLRGPTRETGHYELITYRMKDEPGKLWPANGARCFEVNLTEARAVYGPSCGLPPARHGVRFDGVFGGTARGGRDYHYASGRVSDDVGAVEARFDGRPLTVQLRPIPSELIDRFHIRRPFKFFIASLGDVGDGGLVTVTARDATGQVVGRRRARVPDFSLIREPPSLPR